MLEPDRRYSAAELIAVAEEEIRVAEIAANSNIPGASERIQHWEDTLRVIEIAKQWDASDAIDDQAANATSAHDGH